MITQFIKQAEKNQHPAVQTRRDHLHCSPDGYATLILSDTGMIVGANRAGKKLLDISSKQTYRLHISQIILALTKTDLLDKHEKRVNTYLRFLSRIGYRFKLRDLSGAEFFGELFFSDIDSPHQHRIAVKIQPV
ncbi:MAG: hypothetical protein KF908_12645 [Nitrosomonas sp.]|nr:hypothetical protein [Nitrosomonas sp.]